MIQVLEETQMNRIERLIWEETQLEAIERPRRKSRGTPGAKLWSIAVVVGVAALLASRLSIPPLDDAVVRALVPTSVFYTPAGPSPARDVGPAAGASSQDTAGEVEKAEPHDDPPMAGFAREPQLRRNEPLVARSSAVRTSTGEKRM